MATASFVDVSMFPKLSILAFAYVLVGIIPFVFKPSSAILFNEVDPILFWRSKSKVEIINHP